MKHSLSLLLLLAACPAYADPPSLDIPDEVKPAGQFIIFTPKTDAVSVTYIGLDSLEPLPPAILKDGRMFALDCYGKPVGRYRFAAVAAGKTGEQTRKDFVAVIGTGPLPPNPPNPPNPPADPFAAVLQTAYA